MHGLVTSAEEAGGTITSGGEPLNQPGTYYPLTHITGAEQDSEIVQSELFGPVLTVIPFADERPALQLVNDSHYGLASSVCTNDVACSLNVSQHIKAHVTWVNDHLPIANEAPHGRVKSSSFGKGTSHEFLFEYAIAHHTTVKHAKPVVHDSFRPA